MIEQEAKWIVMSSCVLLRKVTKVKNSFDVEYMPLYISVTGEKHSHA